MRLSTEEKRHNKIIAEAARLEGMLYFERRYAQYARICGVDEAGAGPLAGPVAAAAVIMPAGLTIPGINDSKKLSEKRRKDLRGRILEAAIAYNIAFICNNEIDEINILQARLKAMAQAVANLDPPADFALTDGKSPDLGIPCAGIDQGDAKSHSIACASILAKVARDELMLEYHALYPQYGFARHKGYGTKEHMEAIRAYGLSPIHRRSFCSSFG
ncbi:MAG: ribonuclease HII [Clostridiales bacterium]|nr:ribonuclease HII [Clostridiales bacterium]